MTTISTERSATASGMPVALAIPQAPGPHPAMILMHERYGLVKHTLDISERLAANGYLVACPDLYHEFPDQEALHAGTVTAKVTDEAVLAGLEGVEELIGARFGADRSRLAVMGVCATGRYPLAYAASHPVAGCVTFYGGLSAEQWSSTELHPIEMEAYLDTVEAPILGVYGERDHTIPVEDVRKFRNALEERDKSYEITVYPDVPHGWLNDTMPGRYRREAAEQTWGQLLAYLERVLVTGAVADAIRWSFSAAKAADYDFSKNVRYE